MIIQNAAAFYLSALAIGVIFLYFLRARSKRYDVSSLFLWEGLRHDTRSRAAWIQRRIDPLLILQLLALFLLIFAFAEPAWRGMRPHLSGLAIVLDGSASMRTTAEADRTRYDLASEEGMDLLNQYPETPVTILQLASIPRVLLPLTSDHELARRILTESEPTWYADGSSKQIQTLLDSQGGSDTFERIILLTDRAFDGVPGEMEQIRFEQGENVAITHFTVRENPDQEGVTALITIENYTSSLQERTIVLRAGGSQISAQAILPPGERNTYILPLFGAAGPVFSASITPEDSFQVDDIRYFSLQRPLNKRIRWAGKENRYLLAALSAAQPVVLVAPEDTDPVDLTVAYDTQLSGDTVGNILLIHAGLEEVIAIGEEREGELLTSIEPDDPLLERLDVSNFRILSSPYIDFPEEDATVVLSYGGTPLLLRVVEQEREIVLIAADLMKTNLPLTVDFPILIGNILASLTSPPAPVTTTWALTGQLLDLSEYGNVLTRVEAPNTKLHAVMTLESRSFTPEMPGVYTVTTDEGSYAVAVNVDPSESIASSSPLVGEAVSATVSSKQASILFPAWPYVAVAALLVLIAEGVLYHTGAGWKPRQP